MAKKLGISNKGEALKLQALYNKSVKDGATAAKEQTDATEEQTVATQKATKETNRFAALLGNAVATGLGALAKSTLDLGASLFKNETGVKAFTDQLPGIAGALAPLANYADETIESFRGLSSVGASFGGSITEMRLASAGMGLSLSEMSDLFRGNAANLAALGGSVAQGAVRFQKMNKNLKATGDFKSLMNMGFSVEQINEGMGSYIELQRRMGTLQNKSTQELAAGSADYLMQIDKLAKVTGKTREEAEAMLNEQAADSVARTLLNQFEQGSQEYKNLQTSLALLDEVGGSTAEALKGMLTGNPTEAAGQLLAVLGDAGPDIADAMAQIGQGADPQVLLDAFELAGGELENFAGASATERARIIQELKAQGNPLGDFLDNATKMTELGNRNLADVEAQQKEQKAAQDANTKSLLTFEENQRELSAKLHEIFITSGALDAIGTAISTAGDVLSGIATYLGELPFDNPMEAIGQIIKDGMGALWDNKGVVAALVAGIGLMFAGKAVAGAMGRGVTSALGSVFNKGGGASPAGPVGGGKNTGKGAGNAVANIGKGLGKGLGAVLKGIASGLIAFANPLVPIGAAAVGAAIVAIGAGIAGATWLVGKSLPSLKDGVKGFEELDGEKLKAAGLGMAAIAGGMAAFGAGSAVAGLGSLVGSVTSGIAGLFGGETDPLAQLEKFQEKSFDEAVITSNANSIVAYSKAMAALGAADGLSGIGAAVGAVGGAIAGLFGADDPLDKMKEFGEYSFNTQGIIANAGAVAAYAEAIKNMPTAPAASVMTSAKDAIIGLLGGETDPFAPMKKFGDTTLNTEGIIANAGAVAAYAEAMKDFPTAPAASVFTAAKDAIIGLLGGEVDPFAPMKKFGDYTFNTQGIVDNAGAVSAFAAAMKNMPVIDAERSGGVLGAIAGWFAGDEVMPWDSVKAFGDADINSAGVTANAEAINMMSTSLNSFSAEKLDSAGIISYTEAMEKLVDVLEKMNEELNKDNSWNPFSKGENAGSAIASGALAGSGGGGNNDRLNSVMEEVLITLRESRDLDVKIESNTKNIIGSNLAQGGVSNVGN